MVSRKRRLYASAYAACAPDCHVKYVRVICTQESRTVIQTFLTYIQPFQARTVQEPPQIVSLTQSAARARTPQMFYYSPSINQ